MEFDWLAFRSNKIAVHCPTPESARNFFLNCLKNGATHWCNDDVLNPFDIKWYSRIYYAFDDFGLVHGTLSSAQAPYGREVVTWFDESSIEEVKKKKKITFNELILKVT